MLKYSFLKMLKIGPYSTATNDSSEDNDDGGDEDDPDQHGVGPGVYS